LFRQEFGKARLGMLLTQAVLGANHRNGRMRQKLTSLMHLSLVALWGAAFCSVSSGQLPIPQEERRLILKEQRDLEIRSPEDMAQALIPRMPSPPTVSHELPESANAPLELYEAVRIALERARVIRVLVGTSAQSSGATIYDPTIVNTQIDVNRARFDPTILNNNTWRQNDLPQGVLLPPIPPGTADIFGNVQNTYTNTTTLQKRFLTGGTVALGFTPFAQRFNNGTGLPLNPQYSNSTTLTATQPWLANAGYRANAVPILVARLDTERSFFEMKDRVQELTRGVSEGYWQLVFSNVAVWVREQQIKQTRFFYELNEARFKAGTANFEGDVAQARVSMENFEAQLIGARADRLQREAALRNLLGLPPSDGTRMVAVSLLRTARIEQDWDSIVALAETYRPDLIELKLVLEADQEQLYLAENQAQPQLDTVAQYRWNGLSGTTPANTNINEGGRFNDWAVGVNFSVPLGLRQGRALIRQREILIMRDRANLNQFLHQTSHNLAQNLRNLDQYYEQYLAFRRVREAAKDNLDYRLAVVVVGRGDASQVPFLNLLQAINDWGNAVLNESQSLTLYNIELANLERQTGTILESNGIRFFEEKYGSIGPLGKHFPYPCYPGAVPPGPNETPTPTPESEEWKRPEEYELPDERIKRLREERGGLFEFEKDDPPTEVMPSPDEIERAEEPGREDLPKAKPSEGESRSRWNPIRLLGKLSPVVVPKKEPPADNRRARVEPLPAARTQRR
jgi:outer membrane protein TolC